MFHKRVLVLVVFSVLFSALGARAEYATPQLARQGKVTTASARWAGEPGDLPPAAILEETLTGPWNLSESALPDDATPVARVAGVTRTTLRALTLLESPGRVVTRKVALPPGTSYSLRVLLPFVTGCDVRYKFHLPTGFVGRPEKLAVRLGDGPTLCETKRFGQPEGPHGIRYAPSALGDGRLLRFVTRATNDDGRVFTDEDWFVVYQRSGQTRGFTLPVAAGAERVSTSPGSPSLGIRDGFLRQLREATTLSFALHGSPTALAPTLRFDDPQKVTTTEMARESGRRSWRPPLQLVFGDSCSTLASGARAIPEALGITDATPGRAYVGFDAPAVVDGKTAWLFWDALRAGKTVREATQSAQSYYDSHNFLDGKTYPATLRIVGDPEVRLGYLQSAPSADWWELI